MPIPAVDGICSLSFRQLLRGHVVGAEVVGHVEEALIDAVHVNVIRGEVVQVDGVDVGGIVNVQLHPGRGDNVLDVFRDIRQAAPVLDAKGLHPR